MGHRCWPLNAGLQFQCAENGQQRCASDWVLHLIACRAVKPASAEIHDRHGCRIWQRAITGIGCPTSFHCVRQATAALRAEDADSAQGEGWKSRWATEGHHGWPLS